MTYVVFGTTPSTGVHNLDVAAIEVPRRIHGREYARRFLPQNPLWPGFALDILFYSGLVFLFWSAPAIIRRRIRQRRGRCPACGYDLRATAPAAPCPECGS